MIDRYTLPEMARLWSDQHKLELWKEVETLVVEAWAELGVAPIEAGPAIRRAPDVTPEQVEERERITNHDVAAFVDVLSASVETGGEWVHYGLTSSDVLDTASGVRLKEAADLLIAKVEPCSRR